MNFHEFTVEGDVPISVRDFGGEGPAVLLMHGAGRNLEDMNVIAQNLVRDHRVAAMDFRAHGHSGSGTWEAEAVLDDIARVIEVLGFENPTLAGHSLGGMLSALYAVRRGGVAAVVNWDGYGSGRPEQYLGADPVAVESFLQAAAELGLAGVPGDEPVSSETLAELLKGRVQAADAMGLPVAFDLVGAVRGLVTADDGSVRVVPVRERVEELYATLDAIHWIETFASVRVPFLIYRCEVNLGLPPEYLALMDAYARGLHELLVAMGEEHENITPRILADHHHGFIGVIPDQLAEEARQLIAGAAR